MPPASRITDAEICPAHGGGAISTGSPNTLIGYKPAGRVADTVACSGGPDVIARGATTVLINSRMAARIGDPTAHGATLATGDPTVVIGETPQSFALVGAAASGKPFCAECERLRREREAAAMSETDAPDDDDPSATEPAPPDEVDVASAAQAETAKADAEDTSGVTDAQRAAAAAPGNTAVQRAAREAVVRSFYDRSANDGLGVQRAEQDLGFGGTPPRPNGHPLGYAIDISRPIRVVDLLPEWDAAISVRIGGAAAGLFGNVLDPDTSRDDSASRDAATRRVVVALPAGGGQALQAVTGPIAPSPLDRGPSRAIAGGDLRWIVPSSVKEDSTCVQCGSPPDVASRSFVVVRGERLAPRRCRCAGGST